MTTLDFTPTQVNLKLYAGDDVTIRIFLSTDAPSSGTFMGTWVSSTAYTAGQIVEHSLAFYVAILGSTNVTPGSDATKWRALTPLDLTGYTGWAAQIRSSDTDAIDFTVDDGDQASSIISISVTRADLTSIQALGAQAWDLQATDGSGDFRTFFAGSVTILADATRP